MHNDYENKINKEKGKAVISILSRQDKFKEDIDDQIAQDMYQEAEEAVEGVANPLYAQNIMREAMNAMMKLEMLNMLSDFIYKAIKKHTKKIVEEFVRMMADKDTQPEWRFHFIAKYGTIQEYAATSRNLRIEPTFYPTPR